MSETSSSKLEKLARSGDLNALAVLIKLKLEPENAKVKAEVFREGHLLLKIFPFSKMSHSHYTQEIIKVLNCLQLPGIKIVTVWELSADEKTKIRERILSSANNKFSDSTNFVNLFIVIGLFLVAGIVLSLGYCALPKQSVIQTAELRSDIAIYPGGTQCSTFIIRNPPFSGNDRWVKGTVGVPVDARFLHAKVEKFSGFSYGKGIPKFDLCVSAKLDSIPGRYPVSVSAWIDNNKKYQKDYIINVRSFN